MLLKLTNNWTACFPKLPPRIVDEALDS